MLGELRMRNPTELTLLKSGSDLVVAGYASVELVDKQGDLITRGALNDAFKKFMATPEHANVQLAHSNIQVGTVIPSYTDNNGRMWKSEVDDTGMFVVVKLRNDIEKAREVASEIRSGNLTGFSIGGQAFKRMRKSDKEHGDYQEISKLELHEITICEKGINPEASFRILKEDTTMTNDNVMEQMNDVLTRLEGRLDSMEKGLPPAFLEGKDDGPKEDKEMSEEKDEKDDKKDDDKEEKMYNMEKGNEYSDVITAEYLSWMENTLKSAGVDTGAARQHFDDLNKAQLGGFDNPDSVDGADYFGGQVRGRGQDKGSPSTNAISSVSSSGGKTPAGALGPVKKGYLTADTVSDADIEAAYEVYKAAAQEQNFRGNLEQQFASRYQNEVQAAIQKEEQQQFDARGPLAEISKAIEALGERIDNISTESTTIAKAQGRSTVTIPSTEDLAHMSWDEVHRLADESFRGA